MFQLNELEEQQEDEIKQVEQHYRCSQPLKIEVLVFLPPLVCLPGMRSAPVLHVIKLTQEAQELLEFN